MVAKVATPDKANKLLVEYENLNSDLPPETRRELGLFAIASRVGRQGIAGLLGVSNNELGQTFWRHRSWFWWNCLKLSGLGHHWDEWFVEHRNKWGNLGRSLRRLRREVDEEDWDELGRRVGVPVLAPYRDTLQPSDYDKQEERDTLTIWTKGGTWWKNNNYTKVLILGEHLGPRPMDNRTARAVGMDGVRKLERELYHRTNPDKMLVPDAIYTSFTYARRRLPELAGYNYDQSSLEMVSWFFKCPVENEETGMWYDYYDDVEEKREFKNSSRSYLRW